MPRVTHVKSARKDNPKYGIKKGDSYYHWAFMVGGRGGPKICSKTRPRPSQLTQSDFMSAFLALQERIEDLAADESMQGEVQSIAEDLRSLGEEQRDKKSNMPESLQESDGGQQLDERADACDAVADELDGIDFPDFEQDEERVNTDGEPINSDEETQQEMWDAQMEEVQNVSFDAP